MTVQRETRCQFNDRVRIDGRGPVCVVVDSWHQPIDIARRLRGPDADTEVCIVARQVDGQRRDTVVGEDRLLRVQDG